MNLKGEKKSAILLALIGPEKASEILKELSFFEIESIIKYMSDMDVISNETLYQVLSEFNNSFTKGSYLSVINNNFIISILRKSLGDHDAMLMLNKIQKQKKILYSIKRLNLMNPKKIVNLIQNEHPQIIATILVYLNKNQASNILSYFEDEMCSDIIMRIAKFNGLKELGKNEFIKVINNILDNCESTFTCQEGVNFVIELLKLIKDDKNKNILKKIFTTDSKLAKEINIKMLNLSDILSVEDKYIHDLLKNFSLDELSIAIRNEDEKLKEKFYKNMLNKDVVLLKDSFVKESFITIDVIKQKQKKLLNLFKNILSNSEYFTE